MNETESSNDYQKIYQHYEDCLVKHGAAGPKGLDWPNVEGMITRYKVMADLVKSDRPCQLLDLGCGTGAFYSYLKEHKPFITYSGADISEKFVQVCKEKYPKVTFYQTDILKACYTPQNYDYIIMNGIFTMKCGLTYPNMLDFLSQMLSFTFKITNVGLAFNVMSKHVDWEREDLFHVPHDELANLIIKKLGTRNFVFRNDYGLYEYTTYIYK